MYVCIFVSAFMDWCLYSICVCDCVCEYVICVTLCAVHVCNTYHSPGPIYICVLFLHMSLCIGCICVHD